LLRFFSEEIEVSPLKENVSNDFSLLLLIAVCPHPILAFFLSPSFLFLWSIFPWPFNPFFLQKGVFTHPKKSNHPLFFIHGFFYSLLISYKR